MITTDLSILKKGVDVCVVGSGLVGSTLAIDLAYRGISVLVLESGLANPHTQPSALSDAIIESPEYHHPMAVAVVRTLGGTSELWGGRCAPLDEIDYMNRNFIPHSGWPITYDDVARHERRAAELIGCDDGGFTIGAFASYGETDIDFTRLERWVNKTRIIEQQPILRSSDRISILLNATVVGIATEAGVRTIKGVRIARGRQTIEFNGAQNYILALGGVETARLLLNVQDEHPQLFGGVGGPLGRYYMGHVSGVVADIQFTDPAKAALFVNLRGRKSYSRRRLVLSAKSQLDNQLPNIAFWPENAALFDANHNSGFLSLAFMLLNSKKIGSHAIAEAIRLSQVGHNVAYRKHVKNIVNDIKGVITGAAEVIRQHYLYGRRLPRVFVTNPSGNYPLRFHSEQIPDPTNRIQLAKECDSLGMRRVTVEFKFSSRDRALAKQAHRLIDRSLRNTGLGKLAYHEGMQADDCLPSVMPDGLHQIGITRMSNSPATGVVDKDCKVFDFENLYIAGSSVFPTSGQTSPTLPAVALAVRLSEHLARRISNTLPTSTRDRDKRPVPKPIRVLIVTASYYPAVRYGGPIYTVHSLARALVKRGNGVVVYTTTVDGEADSGESFSKRVLDGVNVEYFPTAINKIYWSPSMVRSLRQNAGKFDIVHAQGAFLYPTVAARIAAVRSRVPFVYSPRGMLVESLIKKKNYFGKMVWKHLFEIENCERAAFVHATSNIEAYEIKQMDISPRSIEVIPNGVDVPEQECAKDEEARRIRLLGERRPYVIILGRVSWKKGIDRLIKAMALVPSINLVIAGNDEENYTPELMRLVREQRLEDRVVFTGPVYGLDKVALLRGAKLFILPSYSESFGVVVIEALSCGCPVLMTPDVGIAHDIEKIGAGVIVQPVPEEIGAAIRSLLADDDRTRRMGDIGRKSVLELFSWDGIADTMETAYRRVLSQQKSV